MFRSVSLVLIICIIILGNTLNSRANEKHITKRSISSTSPDMTTTKIEGKPYKENDDKTALNQIARTPINTISNKECNYTSAQKNNEISSLITTLPSFTPVSSFETELKNLSEIISNKWKNLSSAIYDITKNGNEPIINNTKSGNTDPKGQKIDIPSLSITTTPSLELATSFESESSNSSETISNLTNLARKVSINTANSGKVKVPKLGYYRSRIMGGTSARVEEFPWIALLHELFPNNTLNPCYICGGSLISEEWVLTAAHCLYNRKNLRCIIDYQKTPELYKWIVVQFGDITAFQIGKNVIKTIDLVPHEKYIFDDGNNPMGMNNDIGLVKLSKSINLAVNNNIRMSLPFMYIE